VVSIERQEVNMLMVVFFKKYKFHKLLQKPRVYSR